MSIKLVNMLILCSIQALFLRTTWAESEMLMQSNEVWGCKEVGLHCCDDYDDEGCLSIEALELEVSSDDETESDDNDTESD